ncbi:hypothetical protein CK203_092028 [Vitis vinifera]|uniref:Uncharacterized protein n=1 Tax=Vitis vinifera TaxID=29760 RepID=A0A438CWB5_VITVI|nr:hypothetical protein CK203_092028 [Vitis vinifera]
MSWLPNPFESPQYDAVSNPSNVAGVREDLSVFSQTIGRQLRGVAAFLAPPPSPPSSPSPVAAPSDSSSSASSSPTLRGIRNDLAEIGGSFKSGLKTFSNLFQSQPGDADDECLEDYDGVAGITEEVLHFVSQLSTRPECWTDFPSALDDERLSDLSIVGMGLVLGSNSDVNCLDGCYFYAVEFIYKAEQSHSIYGLCYGPVWRLSGWLGLFCCGRQSIGLQSSECLMSSGGESRMMRSKDAKLRQQLNFGLTLV